MWRHGIVDDRDGALLRGFGDVQQLIELALLMLVLECFFLLFAGVGFEFAGYGSVHGWDEADEEAELWDATEVSSSCNRQRGRVYMIPDG